MRLADKVALVTGASGAIGGAIARRLASEGALVTGTYADHTDMSHEGRGTQGRAVVQMIHLDQRSPAAIDVVVAEMSKKFSRLDILVNSAAWNIRIPFDDLRALNGDVWDRVIETNLRGPFLLARACASLLKGDGGGHIVNISSIGGIVPIGSSVAYAVGKAGLNHLTRCLAVAMAPEVAVNCIAPGLVENTGMSNTAMDPASQEAAREATLLETGARVEDVVDQMMSFVCSTSITGQIISVDGGLPGTMR